jgi:hypothetical protein
MTVQVYDQVQTALEVRLTEYGGCPRDASTGNVLLAFENDRFTPNEGKAWWRVSFVPVDANRGSFGSNGYSRVDGQMIVDLFYPAGEGSGEARRAADDLIHHFKSGTQFTSTDDVEVTIWRAYRMPGFTEPRWYHIPV